MFGESSKLLARGACTAELAAAGAGAEITEATPVDAPRDTPEYASAGICTEEKPVSTTGSTYSDTGSGANTAKSTTNVTKKRLRCQKQTKGSCH